MTNSLHLRLVAASLFVVTGLVACDKAPVLTEASPPAASAAANVADNEVTEHVMTVLNQAEGLRGLDIRVETTNGDVRLTGVVDNQGQIDEALRIARAAEGSHTIHDELTIRK